MTWKDDFEWGVKRASFRGIEFFISRTQLETGRRTIVHRFPGREFAFVQDLGRDTDAFAIEGFVVGDFYHTQRNALIQALTAEGPGELVHPFFRTGQFTVVEKPIITETKEQLGLASFSFRVLEAASPDAFERTSRQAIAKLQAELAALQAQEAYADKWEATVFDTFSLGLLSDATNAIQQANEEINSALGLVDTASAEIAAFGGQLSTLIAQPVSVANTIGQAMGVAFSSVSAILESGVGTFEFFRTGAVLDVLVNTGIGWTNAFGQDRSPVVRGNATANRLADNQEAALQLTRTLFLTQTVQAAVELPAESRSQALRVRDQIAESIDDLQVTADDEAYQELADLKATLITFYDEVAGSTPQLGTFTPKVTMPAVLAAYLFYGDATRDTDIVFRNRVPDPNFLSANEPLEVILDAAA